MKRNPTRTRHKVTLLTDPHPQFNSIVKAGSNGVPIRIMKQEAPMAKNLKHGNATIASLVFSNSVFKTEAEVQAWLDAGGYADTVITKSETDDTFVVKGDETIDQPQAIEVEAGVTAFVGEATEEVADTADADVTAVQGTKTEAPTTGAQKDEDAAVRAKAEELAMKSANLTAEEWASLQPATRDKYADLQIEAAKAEIAATVAPADAIVTDTPAPEQTLLTEAVAKADAFLATLSEKGVAQVARKSTYTVSEVGSVLNSLRWLIGEAEYHGLTDAAIAQIKNAAAAMIGVLVETMQTTIDSFVDAFKAAQGADEPAADAALKTDEAPASEEPAQAGESDAAPNDSSTTKAEADPVLAAIAALANSVSGIAAKVETLGSTVEQSVAKADKLNERLEAVETTSQSRKSADVEELTPANPKPSAKDTATKTSQEVRLRNSNELMGIRSND